MNWMIKWFMKFYWYSW